MLSKPPTVSIPWRKVGHGVGVSTALLLRDAPESQAGALILVQAREDESNFVTSQLTLPERDEGSLFSLDGKCVFPFQYKGGIFYDCIKFKAKHKWCSLTKTYQGQWKYCSEEGEYLASAHLRAVIFCLQG